MLNGVLGEAGMFLEKKSGGGISTYENRGAVDKKKNLCSFQELLPWKYYNVLLVD